MKKHKKLSALAVRAVALYIAVLLLSESTSASVESDGLKIAQPLTTTSHDAARNTAEKADAEANKLDVKTTPITQFIAKHKEALKYWRLAKAPKKEAQKLNKISMAYYVRGEYPKALKYAQEAIPVCQSIGDRECEALATSLVALSYKQMGEYQKAIAAMQLSLQFSQHLGARFGTLVNIAQTYDDKLGEQQKAVNYYNQALAFSKETGDVVKQAESLQYLAYHYLFSGEIDKSIEILQQVNRIDPEFKRDKNYTNLIYLSLSNSSCIDKLASLKKPHQIEQSATDNSDATTSNNIDNFKQKVQKYRALEHLSAEADFLELLGNLEYKRIGEYQKSLEVYQQELKLRKITGGKPDEAETLTNIADVLNLQGKKQEAINALNQALDIQRQIKTRPAQADTWFTLGDVYLSLGAYPESLNAYNQALSLSQITGKREDEITTLRQIGVVYQKMQQYPQALNSYQQALSISRKTGNCNREATLLEQISRHHFLAGNYQQAINFSNQALAVVRKLDIVEYKLNRESNIFDILAQVEIKQGNYSQALEYSQKARKLGRESTFKQTEAYTISSIAEAYKALKQPQKAIQTYQEQLTLYQEMGLVAEQAQSLYNIAKLQRQNNQLQAALTEIDKAIAIIENIRKEVTSPDLRTSFLATKQDYYRLKIDLLMELHKKDPSKGYNAQAIETSEASRARGLVELLTEARANIRKGANPELLAEERRIQALIDGKEKVRFEIVNSDKINNPIFKTNAEKLQAEINELLRQQKELETKIRQTSPQYANLKYPQPLTLDQIQQQLDKDTLLLQYSLGSERSFLWVVSPNSLDTYELPKKQEIEKSAINLFCLISNYSSQPPSVTNKENPCANIKTQQIDSAAKELSQLILAPVKDKLGKKRLVIVADGALQYIPFATLADLNFQPTSTPQQNKPKNSCENDRGIFRPCTSLEEQSLNYQPLLVNHEIVSLPSASTIAIQRQQLANRPQAPQALAILADPVYNATDTRVTSAQNKQLQKQDSLDLELERSALKRSADSLNRQGWTRLLGTRKEAETIFKLVPNAKNLQLLDFAANYTAATSSNLNQFRILHFATHGFVNDANPELSGLVLSLVNEQGKDIRGYLRLGDLFNLDYPADLIVLSACETGLGKEIQGEGLVGLTRGLMYAGAERLLVSLWKVSDEGTSEFMQEFYKQMWQQNKSASQALRATQLKMWEQEKWRNPNYWAAFTFLGEWN